MQRADSLEKILMLGKIEGRREGDDRGWDGWMASPTQWTWVWVNSGSWRWTGRPGVLRSMGSQSQIRLSDWTTAQRLPRWSNGLRIHPALQGVWVGSLARELGATCHSWRSCVSQWRSEIPSAAARPSTVKQILLIYIHALIYTYIHLHTGVEI